MAQKYFGDEEPLNKTLLFDNTTEMKITGVVKNVPNNSHFKFDFLVPFFMYQRWDTNEWNVNNFHNYLLLAKGASAEELETKMPEFIRKYAGEKAAAGSIVKLQPMTDIHLHSNLRKEFEANSDITYIYMFSAIALFVLLIACINFMNLTTARSASRAKEVGIRKVVGSQRLQLIRQFLGESLFLSIIAIILALGMVELLLQKFNTLAAKELSLNFSDNMFLTIGLVGIALIVGIISGAYPAFFLSAFRPLTMMKGSFRAGSKRSLLRKGLIIVQFTISIVLIIGTGIVYRQLAFIQNKKLGFEKEQVIVVRMGNSVVQQKQELFKNQALQNPNILNVSATSNLLGGSDWGMPFFYEGAKEDELFSSRALVVDDKFIETYNMEIVAGRNFSREFTTDISGAYILNETAVKQLAWDNPIGKRFGRPSERNEKGQVIGVVKDFHFRSLHETIEPLVMYMVPEWFSYFSIRIRPANIPENLAFLEGTWQSFEQNRPFDYFFLDELFARMYRAEQRLGNIFGVFSALAIFIACLGLFGLASFLAEQRTKEIGVRKALGASVSNIVLLLSKDFTKWVLAANVIAWPIAYLAMNNWLQDFAYRITIGLEAFLVAGIIAMVIALVTLSFQAIKAAFTNPIEALRCD